MLAGRTEAIRRYKTQYPDLEDAEINSRLVGYCSDQVRFVLIRFYFPTQDRVSLIRDIVGSQLGGESRIDRIGQVALHRKRR